MKYRRSNELSGPQAVIILGMFAMVLMAFYLESNKSERRDWCAKLARPASPDYDKCLILGPDYVKRGWYRKRSIKGIAR